MHIAFSPDAWNESEHHCALWREIDDATAATKFGPAANESTTSPAMQTSTGQASTTSGGTDAPANPTDVPAPKRGTGGISRGAMAGIGFGIAVALIALTLTATIAYRRRSAKSIGEDEAYMLYHPDGLGSDAR